MKRAPTGVTRPRVIDEVVESQFCLDSSIEPVDVDPGEVISKYKTAKLLPIYFLFTRE